MMEQLAEAILEDGRAIPYVKTDNPPRGGMKHTYFAPDRSYVVQFYNDPAASSNGHLRSRVHAILGPYNPTLSEKNGGSAGNTETLAEYFFKRFCWPIATVQFPQFGLVCPTYPDNFFFSEASAPQLKLKGKDKKSHWFTSDNRQFLSREERGNFKSMMDIAIMLTRSIRRLHQAGLAHSDLSNNNVLIDPKSGSCIIIDIDSLVVPDMFPPEVIGTRGYIAPEILATLGMPFGDPRRKAPGILSDLYALGVLLYEYLFLRHPLVGPKVHDRESRQKNDFLMFGPKAVFIEDPHDLSNHPTNLQVQLKDAGPFLEELFLRVFTTGLHHADERPTAMEWERGLAKTYDLLHRCSNPKCEQGWFVLYDEAQPICPYCHMRLISSQLVRFYLKTEIRGRAGQWLDDGVLNIESGSKLYQWHLYSHVFADEKADESVQARVEYRQGQWWLINEKIQGMMSEDGHTVPKGEGIILKNHMVFRITRETFSKVIFVTIKSLA